MRVQDGFADCVCLSTPRWRASNLYIHIFKFIIFRIIFGLTVVNKLTVIILKTIIFQGITASWPKPVALRSKSCVCGLLLAVLQVRIPPGAWMSVSYEWCVLSGRGLSDETTTLSYYSYRVCGVETSGGLGPTWAATLQNAKYCTLCAYLALTKFVFFLIDTKNRQFNDEFVGVLLARS
jgi:hypothetical protein